MIYETIINSSALRKTYNKKIHYQRVETVKHCARQIKYKGWILDTGYIEIKAILYHIFQKKILCKEWCSKM